MVHRYTVGLDLDAVAGKKLGFALMAKRGHQYIVVEGTKNMNALILPAADAAFVDDIPASMSPEVVDVLRSNGTTNSNYVARHLSYTDADVAAWIAATEWGRSPVLIRSQDNLVRLALEQGTGLFISYPEGAHLTVNLVGTDQGDFSADWRG